MAQAYRSVPIKQWDSSGLTSEAREILTGELFLQSTAKWKLEGLEQSGADGFPWEDKKGGLMKQNHAADTATPFKDGPDQALKLLDGAILLGFLVTKMGASVLPELKGQP